LKKKKKKQIEEQEKLLELIKQDRETNNIGKEVVDGLFVGSMFAAENQDFLESNEITCILNVTKNIPNFFDGILDIEYKRLEFEDTGSDDISSIFEESSNWIEKRLLEKKKIFVHCKEGRSRSCTIVMSYLMQSIKKRFQEAHDIIFKVRPLIRINDGFVQQLKVFERALFDLQEEEDEDNETDEKKVEEEETIPIEFLEDPNTRRSSRKRNKISYVDSLDNAEEESQNSKSKRSSKKSSSKSSPKKKPKNSPLKINNLKKTNRN